MPKIEEQAQAVTALVEASEAGQLDMFGDSKDMAQLKARAEQVEQLYLKSHRKIKATLRERYLNPLFDLIFDNIRTLKAQGKIDESTTHALKMAQFLTPTYNAVGMQATIDAGEGGGKLTFGWQTPAPNEQDTPPAAIE